MPVSPSVPVHGGGSGRRRHGAGSNRCVGIEAVQGGCARLAVRLQAVRCLEGNHCRLCCVAERAVRCAGQVAQGFQARLHRLDGAAVLHAGLQRSADGGNGRGGFRRGGRIQRLQRRRPGDTVRIQALVLFLERLDGVFCRTLVVAVRRTRHPAQFNQARLQRADACAGRTTLEIILSGEVWGRGGFRLGGCGLARSSGCGGCLDSVGAVQLCHRRFARDAVHQQIVAVLERAQRLLRRVAEIAVNAAGVVAQLLQAALERLDISAGRAFFENGSRSRRGCCGRPRGGGDAAGRRGHHGDNAVGRNHAWLCRRHDGVRAEIENGFNRRRGRRSGRGGARGRCDSNRIVNNTLIGQVA